MSVRCDFESLAPRPPPPPTRSDTYWDNVIAGAHENSRGPFVAAGFDMWIVWSQIATKLKRTANDFSTLFPEFYDPDDDSHGTPSFKVSVTSPPADGRVIEPHIACPPISSITWQPSSGEQHPNPWSDVLNFVPARPESPACFFPFGSLPIELGQYIISLLPKESAAALSTTSRAMYNLVPRQLFAHLSISERWRLMLLLERDSELLVACQICIKLHSPFKPNSAPCQRQWQILLPEGITPALCRLLAKSYIRQRNYSDLLCIAGRTETHILRDFKARSSSTLRMIDGSLFVRLETHIAPLTPQGDLTGSSAYELDSILDSSKNSQVCPHVRWQHLGLDLAYSYDREIDRYSSLSASYLGSQLSNERYLRDQLEGRDPLKHRLFSLDFRRELPFFQNDQFTICDVGSFCRIENPWPKRHTRECYGRNPLPRTVLNTALSPGLICALFHHQPCTKRECTKLPGRYRVNLVRACEICATDMCVGAQDVEGVGRVISLTTWKNLGGVYDGQWANWYPHSVAVGRFTGDFMVNSQGERITRDMSKGTMIYSRFEGQPPIRGPAWYTAPVSDQITAIFTGQYDVYEPNWLEKTSLLYLNVV